MTEDDEIVHNFPERLKDLAQRIYATIEERNPRMVIESDTDDARLLKMVDRTRMLATIAELCETERLPNGDFRILNMRETARSILTNDLIVKHPKLSQAIATCAREEYGDETLARDIESFVGTLQYEIARKKYRSGGEWDLS